MPIVTIEPYEKESDLAEAYSNGIEFAMVNGNRQITPFTTCKSFIPDNYAAFFNNKPFELWGWSYNPQEQPLETHRTAILVRDRDKPQKKLANTIRAGIEKVLPKDICDNIPITAELTSIGATLVTSQPIWLKTPQTLSFFLACIRRSATHPHIETRDLVSPWEFYIQLMSQKTATLEKIPPQDAYPLEHETIEKFHDYYGCLHGTAKLMRLLEKFE